MNYKKAWLLLQSTLNKGLESNSKHIDKATILQVQLIMATLESSMTDKE